MPPWNMRLKNSQRFEMIALCARIVSLSTTKVMSANAFDCSIRPRSALIVDGDTAGGFGRSSPSSDIRSVGAYAERKWVHTARVPHLRNLHHKLRVLLADALQKPGF